MRRILVPVLALLAAGLIGGVGAVGVWEAVDDEPNAVERVGSAELAADEQNGSGSSIADLYRRVSPGVVQIRVEGNLEQGVRPFEVPPDVDPFDEPPQQQGASGSGFVIDAEGHVVTNEHVVGSADTVTVVFADGDEVEARVVGTDASTDVALLELVDSDHELTPLELGSSEGLEIGDTVIAIGSPFGLQGTLTVGVVSGLDRNLQSPNGFTIAGAIQTDAALNSGNSGGPLLDATGHVVGINSQIESRTGGNVGIGYAVPIETVRTVIDQLLEDGEVEHAYLGVRLQELPAGADGVEILEIIDDGPAADAGLRQGDVVLAADGKQVDTVDDVRAAVDAKKPGDQLRLRISRDSDERTVTVELGRRPTS